MNKGCDPLQKLWKVTAGFSHTLAAKRVTLTLLLANACEMCGSEQVARPPPAPPREEAKTRLQGPNWGLRVGISLPLLLNQTQVPSPTGCRARSLMPRCDEGKYPVYYRW